jgi:hypothetical protein
MRVPAGLVVAMILAAGCTRTPPSRVVRWSRASGGTIPVAFQSYESELATAKSLNFGRGQSLTRIGQRVAGAEIEGTWIQTERNSSGRLQSLTMNVVEDISPKWADEIQKVRDRKDRLLVDWFKVKGRRFINFPTDSEVVVAKVGKVYHPALRIRTLLENEGVLREILYDSSGDLLAQRKLTLPEVDGLAMVFPGLPNHSVLSAEILPLLLGDGTLTGTFIRAISADGKIAANRDNDFRYNPDQREFDDVQAYFFADEQATWFEHVLNFKLAKRLDVKLHLGAPVPGNAMFYYDGQIRLGDGDGKTYRGIPRDPSIVKHEVSHAYVQALSGLGFEDDPGVYSEAFSDLFTALAMDRPAMGEYAFIPGPFRRTIDNEKRADRDLMAGKYEKSLVVSGTFWEIRRRLGAELTAQLARAFLLRIGQGGTLKDFNPVFRDAALAALSPENQVVAFDIINARGWGTVQ